MHASVLSDKSSLMRARDAARSTLYSACASIVRMFSDILARSFAAPPTGPGPTRARARRTVRHGARTLAITP